MQINRFKKKTRVLLISFLESIIYLFIILFLNKYFDNFFLFFSVKKSHGLKK